MKPYSGWEIEFKLQDLWVGAYWQRDKCGPYQEQISIWICVIPMFPLHIYWIAPNKRSGMKTFQEWHNKYKNYMIEMGVSEEEAESALQAGMGNYDYSLDPEMSASDELSYWTDDG